MPAPSRVAIVGLLVVAVAASLVPQLAGWTSAGRVLEVSGRVGAAMLTACLGAQASAAADRAVMPPSFIFIFAALLRFGPNVAMVVAAASALAGGVIAVRASRLQLIADTMVTVAATGAAAFGYQLAGAVPAMSAWPLRALPLNVYQRL